MISLQNTKHIIKNTLRYFVLFLVFAILCGTVLVGVQWFSNTVEGFFSGKVSYDENLFTAGLEASTLGSSGKTIEEKPILQESLLEIDLKVDNLELSAESAISIEFTADQEKVLFKKNENKKLFIASLTKLMTAAVVLDNYNLSQKVRIEKEDADQGGYLDVGDFFSIKTLLYVSLIESDNSAAYALSRVMGEDTFVKLMNEKANEFGLFNTHFFNSVGFGLNYSTAMDLAKLSEKLIKEYPLIFKISSIPEFKVYSYDGKFHHNAVSTNKLLVDTSINWRDGILGGKTGSGKFVKENLILVLNSADDRGYLINVILKSNDRFGEMKKLIAVSTIGQAENK